MATNHEVGSSNLSGRANFSRRSYCPSRAGGGETAPASLPQSLICKNAYWRSSVPRNLRPASRRVMASRQIVRVSASVAASQAPDRTRTRPGCVGRHRSARHPNRNPWPVGRALPRGCSRWRRSPCTRPCSLRGYPRGSALRRLGWCSLGLRLRAQQTSRAPPKRRSRWRDRRWGRRVIGGYRRA